MIPATYPSILDSSNRTKMLVYQVPSITGLTRWVDYIPVKSPASESDLTLANTFANEGFILTSKVNDITGLVPFKDYVPIYLDSTATKAWSADNDGYIPMAELAGLLLDFTTGALDPRIAFTRATNATVTNSAGVITYAPHNLITNSEQFDNAAWTKINATVLTNANVAPNGTITADAMIANSGATSSIVQSQTLTAGVTYSYSVYAKYNGETYLRLQCNNGSSFAFADLNTQTGVISPASGTLTNLSSSVSPVGNGWYRGVLTFTIASTGGCIIYLNGLVAGNGYSGIFIWGAQLEAGTSPTAYNSTTVKNLLGFSELFDNAAWTKSNSFVQTNLLTFSEAFDNAAWSKTTVTATANSFIAPNGYQTADTLLATGANSTALQTFTASAVPYTFSVYLYRKTGTGNIDITVDGTTWVTKTITAGWTRVDTTLTPAAGSKTAGIRIVTSGDEVYAWGAQLVQGSDAGAYRRTDSASLPCYYPNHNGVVCAEQLHGTAANGTILESYTASGAPMTFSVWMRRITGTGNVDITMDTGVTWTTQAITTSWARYSITSTPASGARTAGIRLVTSGDVIQVFGAQLSDSASLDPYVLNAAAAPTAAAYYGARFDYDPVTLAPKGLLIEEQRTNLLTYSDDIENALGWVAYGAGTAVNNVLVIDPSGKQNTTEINMPSANTGWHTNNITVSAGTTYSASIWIKADSAGTIRFFDGNGSGFDSTINVTTSWQRVSTAALKSAGAATQFAIYRNTLGDLSKVYIWGAQLEAGAFATSYIPTAASQVTRAADVPVIQGSNFYSWYNLNASTLYVKGKFNGGAENFYAITGSSYGDFGITQRRDSSTTRIYDVYTASGVYVGGSSTSVLSTATEFKEAIAFTTSSAQASVNGVLGSIVSGYISTGNANRLAIGQYFFTLTMNGHIKQISYYPQRLSNDVLVGLTR